MFNGSFQIYWPSWWQIWPYYSVSEPFDIADHSLQSVVCCIGPFQWSWYKEAK